MTRFVTLGVISLSASLAVAQTAGTRPASQPANTVLADSGLRLKVTDTRGSVRVAPIGVDSSKDDGWSAVALGDLIGGGMQIRTGARSGVTLVLDPPTPPSIIAVERNTLASVDELFKASSPQSGDAVITRLGLARGSIVGGVAEGSVRSDLEIRSPVATLAKRGTWDFRLFVEPGTGRFEISLADRGLVQAINQLTGQSKLVLPGQAITQAMLRWVEMARFNQPVGIQDWYGLKGAELVFNLTNQGGMGVLALNGNGGPALSLGRPEGRAELANTLQDSLERDRGERDTLRDRLLGLRPGDNIFGPRRRGEGDFGVGQGVLPVVLDKESALVKRGFAKPGRFDVWRSDARQYCTEARNSR